MAAGSVPVRFFLIWWRNEHENKPLVLFTLAFLTSSSIDISLHINSHQIFNITPSKMNPHNQSPLSTTSQEDEIPQEQPDPTKDIIQFPPYDDREFVSDEGQVEHTFPQPPPPPSPPTTIWRIFLEGICCCWGRGRDVWRGW